MGSVEQQQDGYYPKCDSHHRSGDAHGSTPLHDQSCCVRSEPSYPSRPVGSPSGSPRLSAALRSNGNEGDCVGWVLAVLHFAHDGQHTSSRCGGQARCVSWEAWGWWGWWWSATVCDVLERARCFFGLWKEWPCSSAC